LLDARSAAAALAAAQSALSKSGAPRDAPPSAPPRRATANRDAPPTPATHTGGSLGGSRSAMKMFMNAPRTLDRTREAPVEEARPAA
jgi:hypothetical protein